MLLIMASLSPLSTASGGRYVMGNVVDDASVIDIGFSDEDDDDDDDDFNVSLTKGVPCVVVVVVVGNLNLTVFISSSFLSSSICSSISLFLEFSVASFFVRVSTFINSK